MFSRFFNTTKALFKKSRSDQEPLDSPASSEQLHSELSDAVEVGMVTTRRQSHGLPNEELRDGSEIDTPRTVSRKRKNGNSESSTPMGGPAKRRKSGLEIADDNGSDGSGTSALMASRQQGLATKVDSQKLGGNEAAGQKEDALALVGQRSVPELGTAETWTEPDDNTPGIKHRQRSTSQRAGAVLLGTARDDQHSAADVKIAALTRAMPPHDILKQYNETASVLNANSEVNKTSGNGMSTMSKATHFRFGSEEPDVKAQAMSKGQTHLEAQSASILERSEESDNEDEAPEIVTASAGVKTARARTLEAAKAAER